MKSAGELAAIQSAAMVIAALPETPKLIIRSPVSLGVCIEVGARLRRVRSPGKVC